MLKGKTVVLGVTGSIAAYKIANLASMLVKQHCDVHVIMTKNATNFINPIAFETLTNNKCLVDTFDRNFQFQPFVSSPSSLTANSITTRSGCSSPRRTSLSKRIIPNSEGVPPTPAFINLTLSCAAKRF